MSSMLMLVVLAAAPALTAVDGAVVVGDGLVVAELHEESCPASCADAWVAGGPGTKALRGIDLASGEERWRSEETPVLVAVVRSGQVVQRLVAVAASGEVAAVLDPRDGTVQARCVVARRDAGAQVVRGVVHVGTQLEVPLVPVVPSGAGLSPHTRLVLKVKDRECSLSWEDGEVHSTAPWRQRGVTLSRGGDAQRGWLDVGVGARRQRVVTAQRLACALSCPPPPGMQTGPRRE